MLKESLTLKEQELLLNFMESWLPEHKSLAASFTSPSTQEDCHSLEAILNKLKKSIEYEHTLIFPVFTGMAGESPRIIDKADIPNYRSGMVKWFPNVLKSEFENDPAMALIKHQDKTVK